MGPPLNLYHDLSKRQQRRRLNQYMRQEYLPQQATVAQNNTPAVPEPNVSMTCSESSRILVTAVSFNDLEHMNDMHLNASVRAEPELPPEGLSLSRNGHKILKIKLVSEQ